jgi:N-acetyl-gamma-glutamyl-phosphate reductase
MKPLIFIDGEHGTTGLQIQARLAGRTDITILTLAKEDRKVPQRRSEAINSCDIAILCLPDDAARQAVSFIENPSVRVIDASSAHRTDKGWVYGFPEMAEGQSERIATAMRVSNPGCYPTGAVALLRPLVDAGLIPSNYPLIVHAVSGYSGAGSSMIDAYEHSDPAQRIATPYSGYGLGLEHKHILEIEKQANLTERPIFLPALGKYRQGIALSIPLHLRLLPEKIDGKRLQQQLQEHYEGASHVSVTSFDASQHAYRLEPEDLNDSNQMRLSVFFNQTREQAVLTAVYDNLGKGASGAAVQNLDLMLAAPRSPT